MSFPRYPEYKDSGVEWLGAVPVHWEVWKVSHAFGAIGSGTTPPSNEDHWYDSVGTPWVTTGELRENIIKETSKSVTNAALEKFSALRVHPAGSLVVAMYGATIGRLGILGVDAVTNQACCVLSAPRHLDIAFTYYWLQGFKQIIIDLFSTGGGQPNINQDIVASLRIPAPGLPEQTAIATFLDHETAKIDALVAEQEKLIALLQEKRQAVISHAVTKGLDPNVPMKDSGVEWLGEVPAHWNVAAVNYRYEVLLGKMLDEKRITGEHLAPYLRNVDVQWDRINTDDLPQMDFEGDELERYGLRKGDLLVCEGGEVGRAAIWSGALAECYYQKALHRLRPRGNRRDLSRFQYYLLNMAATLGIFTGGEGRATIAHLTAETLRRYRFAYPPHTEQMQIVDFLDAETVKFDTLTAQAQSAITLLQERRTALISAAVTGQIDVRGWQAAQT